MALLVSVAFGIASMLLWGVIDFLTAGVARRLDSARMLLYTMLIGMVPVAAFALWSGANLSPTTGVIAIIAGQAIGAAVGYVFFYAALRKGDVSVASPLVNSWAAFTVPVAILAFAEYPNALQVAGILLALIGILLTAAKPGEKTVRSRIAAGAGYALLSAAAFGIINAFVKPVVSEIGPVGSTFFFRGALIGLCLAYFAFARRSPVIGKKEKPVLPMLVAIGLLDALGGLTYNYGVNYGLASVVAPVAASAPAVTVLLARHYLKEKLALNQKIGIALIIAAVVILAAS